MRSTVTITAPNPRRKLIVFVQTAPGRYVPVGVLLPNDQRSTVGEDRLGYYETQADLVVCLPDGGRDLMAVEGAPVMGPGLPQGPGGAT